MNTTNDLKLWTINPSRNDVFLFSKKLSEIGFLGEIETFSEIQRACDELDHIMDVRCFPDIIFLEIDSQHDKAFYFLEKLKRRRLIVNNSTRVVILTTYLDRRLEDTATKFDFVDHVLRKPVNKAKLRQIGMFNSTFIREFSAAK